MPLSDICIVRGERPLFPWRLVYLPRFSIRDLCELQRRVGRVDHLSAGVWSLLATPRCAVAIVLFVDAIKTSTCPVGDVSRTTLMSVVPCDLLFHDRLPPRLAHSAVSLPRRPGRGGTDHSSLSESAEKRSFVSDEQSTSFCLSSMRCINHQCIADCLPSYSPRR